VNLTTTSVLSIPVTVTGMATFNDGSLNQSTITGDATFNNSSQNNFGTVTGNATFNNSSYNSGTVSGNATFNNDSYNNGTVTGNATFNDGSYNNNYTGIVTGVATFNDSSRNEGQQGWNNFIFNDTSYNNVGGGIGTFNDYSHTRASCFPTFNDYSYNSDAVFHTVYAPTFNDYSYNLSEVDYGSSATFNDYSEHRNGYLGLSSTFNHNSRCLNQPDIYNRSVTFNDSSYGSLSAATDGTVVINGGPIQTSGFSNSNGGIFSFTRAQPINVIAGINGSSILGIV
jgi:hypothetical protein